MELSGKQVAVFVEEMYQELELWYPVLRLREAGAQVTVVGPKGGEVYKSKSGYPAKSDQGIDQVSPSQFDALVIPGGYAPDYMRRNEAMVRFVREMVQAGKVVAAICHAGWMLASAGVVSGRRVTSFFSIRDDLRHAGAEWVDAEVVVDGRLITSRRPDDLPAFSRAILQALAG